jgi:hypothetical protein
MFNILVADSVENELNHLILLLEDYKANNPEFDRILNIIDASSYDDAINIIDNNQIDILFISSDMDKVAFKAYKKDFNTLIISASNSFERLKKWYIDHLVKPFCKEIFNLRFRSYLDILIFNKVGISSYERTLSYDLNIISNLHLFWKSHFSTKSNQNEIVHIIYSLSLSQIDRGIPSTVTVVESDTKTIFRLKTELNSTILKDLEKIERGVKFSKNENELEFVLDLTSEEVNISSKMGEYEDFALEYLSYDKLDLLNDFLTQHDLIEEENGIREFEERLAKSGEEDFKYEDFEIYIQRKKRQGEKRYSFMDETDLKVFGDIVDELETMIINNRNGVLSMDEIEFLIDHLENISQILSIYPSAKSVSQMIENISEKLLINGKSVVEHREDGLNIVGRVVELLGDWTRMLSKRESSEEV